MWLRDRVLLEGFITGKREEKRERRKKTNELTGQCKELLTGREHGLGAANPLL